MPSLIVNPEAQKSSDLEWIDVNRSEALQVASKAFARSLKIQPQNVSSWQDLALSFHYRWLLCKNGQEKVDEKDNIKGSYKDQCFAAIRKALALCPKDYTLWNILGVFAIRMHGDTGLAQHSFVRSIGLSSNAIAWANLGVLYFTQARPELANKAFKEAQNQDPTHLQVNCLSAKVKEILERLGSARIFDKLNFPALFSNLFCTEKSAGDFD